MIEVYPEIRLAHIAAGAVSGGRFFVRGIGNAIGAPRARAHHHPLGIFFTVTA